jgi:hypothetical protein
MYSIASLLVARFGFSHISRTAMRQIDTPVYNTAENRHDHLSPHLRHE